MSGILADFFRTDVRCAEADAVLLTRLARERVPGLAGSAEDTDEDIVVRLADPRVFGAFAAAVLAETRLSRGSRVALADHVFDLLPLPRTEGDVILVPSRSPSDLLRTALFASEAEGLTVLHVMHLVYSVFLDRTLVSNASRLVRSQVLFAVLHQGESSERLRVLYACLHVAAVPEPEAHNALKRILRDRETPDPVKAALAHAVSASDGGLGAVARMASEEGLLLPESGDADAPGIVANIPRFPLRLGAEGRRWLERHASTRAGDRPPATG